MGKGYAEGPAAEERFAELERAERGTVAEEAPAERPAVYGSTDDDPERHFLGWLDEVDPDELFAAGEAWGLTVVRRREPLVQKTSVRYGSSISSRSRVSGSAARRARTSARTRSRSASGSAAT